MDSTFDPHWVDSSGSPVFMLGECLGFTIVDPANPSPPGVSNNVINPQQPFNIELEWRICGLISPLWLSALAALGSPNWVVEIFAESIGEGPELQIAQTTVPVLPLPTNNPPLPPERCFNYKADVTVPPNTLVEGNPGIAGPSGVYKLVATVFLNSNIPLFPGFDICGFCEGRLIKAENPL